VIVDLFPRHDPLNPLGILGITRWGSSLTCAISAKGSSEENRVVVTSTNEGKAVGANVAVPESKINDFVDAKAVTYAAVSVAGYDGSAATCTRHFVFVKNAFLFVRDVVSAPRPMDVTLASVFNTQNIGPRLSSHAALTYMSQPPALDVGLLNPPVDLLVYHCPQPDAQIEVIDRTALDPRAENVRAQLRYAWSGRLSAENPRWFSTLFHPQPPTPAGPLVSSDPDEEGGTPHAPLDTSFIETLAHDHLATVLRINGPDDREQWVVCNPEGRLRTVGDLQTDASAAYVEILAGEPSVVWQYKGSTLMIRGRNLAAAGGQAEGGTK
jgi:hypothetical protein